MTVRMRSTKSHTGNRRAHHRLKNPAISKDSDGNVHLRHRVSPVSGKYRGRQVIDVAKKILKKETKRNSQSKKEKK